MYHVKAHPIATKFLGFTLKHDRQLRTFAISYPGYADALLTRLRPDGVKPSTTPSIYTPPRFGSTAPQAPTTDSEPPASAAQRKRMQHLGQNKEYFVFFSQNHQVTYFVLRIRK
jgi:hypothetical protein